MEDSEEDPEEEEAGEIPLSVWKPSVHRASDRAILERIAGELERQQEDLKVLRWRTGCLFAWHIFVILILILSFLFSVPSRYH